MFDLIRTGTLVSSAALLAAAVPAVAQDVTVTLDGVKPNAGKLYIALQTREQFMQDVRSIGTVLEPTAATVTATLPDVPPGDYALSVWHDIDGDGTFSMGPMGPTDGWAMVDGAALRGEPTFDMVDFTVTPAGG